MAHSIVDEHPALRESLRLKILVVDDHPLIREALVHVLTVLDSEIKLFEACNGAEGLAAAEAHPDLDLVLLDLGLPDMDGFDALARLREGHPGLRIVVLSASEQAEVVVRALDAGAMGFIPKTSSNQLLINALRLVLSGGVYLPPEVLRRPSGAARPVSERTPASPQGHPPTPRDLGLTGRQAEVLALMVQGKPNKLICRELDLAEGTVKIHVTAILKALGVANRTQAVIEVSRLGMKLDPLAPGSKNKPAA